MKVMGINLPIIVMCLKYEALILLNLQQRSQFINIT